MPIESYIHHCARNMLGVKELNLDLRNYLDDVEMYANFQDGSIASRQIVAVALATYRRVRLLEQGMDKIDWNKLRDRDE